MTKFSDIKGFIFDLDGVISNTSILHSKAWHQIANEVGTPWNNQLANDLKGVSRMDSLNLILKDSRYNKKYTDNQKKNLAMKKNQIYLQLVSQMTPNDILPGIKQFLKSLKDNNYLIALASASKNAPQVLNKLELTKFFPKIVNPAKLKIGKPDPEIYISGAKLLNLNPNQCIGIEDAKVGIDAINAANETSIGIGNNSVLKHANIVFPNTIDLTLENVRKKLV